jgi:arabinogalactan endo-1,4-beta-galactosidase
VDGVRIVRRVFSSIARPVVKGSLKASMKRRIVQLAVLVAVLVAADGARAQGSSAANGAGTAGFCPPLAVGADVSFLPEAEARGDVFSDETGQHPALEILRNHGYGWVRLRLFNDPTTLPNDLAYTLAEAKKAKALGLGIVLDFHYADDWADPQHQPVPAAWAKLKHPQLVEATFEFTRDTLARFRAEGVMPNMVQIGNEVTSGMMWPDGKLPDNWTNFTDLLLAAARGVAEGSKPDRHPPIMIHIDKGGNAETTKWFFSHVIGAGVPFDVIGQSYYPWWQGSLGDLKENLIFMANEYRKPIVVIETAYSWEPQNYIKKRAPFPETPEGQRDFLRALAETVAATPHGLGKGVFWWEPAVDGAHKDLVPRALFDDKGHALPAMHVFDGCMAAPPAQH